MVGRGDGIEEVKVRALGARGQADFRKDGGDAS